MKNFKTTLSLILCLVFVFSFAFVAPVRAEEEEANVRDIVILHTNDSHGRAVSDIGPDWDGMPLRKGVIGWARYKTMIDKIKEANEDRVLVLDAGDTIHGTNFATLSKGQSVIRIMNQVGVQAMTLGNHDFNYGQEELDVIIKEADFPLLAANIVREDDGEKPYESNVIFEVDGLKIGVFGIATPETKVKSSPVNTEGLDFVDPVEMAKEEVAALQEEGVDAIIMLAHLGIDEESEDTSIKVLEEVEGIDVCIDGHSHTLLEEGEMIGETLLVQTGAMFENVGVLTLTFSDNELTEKTSQMIDFLSAQQYEPDEEVLKSIEAIEEENKRFTEVEVGEVTVDLEGEREDVRTGETNMGDLILDAMLWASDADCALSNGGGIRASIPAGMVTMGDLLTVLPFGNMMTVIEVTGQDIVDALVFGTDAYPDPAGKFPHVANLTYELVPADEGYEVQNVKLGGEDIDLEATYKLATNDFLAIGGDGYEMFEGKEQLLLEGLLVDIMHDYIVEVLMADGDTFEYGTDDRIVVVE